MSNPLVIKDGNQQQQLLSTQADAGGNLAMVHAPAFVVGSIVLPVSATNPLPVINTTGVVALDGSGSITTGGQAQPMFSGQAPINGYLIANNSAGTLYHSDVGTASAGGASLPIAPGATFMTPPGYKPNGAVSIFGAVISAQFAARRW